jgi:spermidine synthase
VSTLGSLVGTLLAGLWLLPYLPLGVTFAGTALVVLLPVIASARLMGVAGLVIVTTSFAVGLVPSGATSRATPPDGACELHHKRQSHFGELRVIDCPPDLRLLLTNGMEQGAMSIDSGFPPYPYAEFFVAAARRHIDRPRRALLIGVGPGMMVRPLQAMGQVLDLVEVDPEVVAIGRRYFGLRGPVIVDDGRRFLRGAKGQWDVIYLDAVLGGNPPWHLYTHEAFAQYRSRLAHGGAVVMNFVGHHTDPEQRPALEALVATAKTVFATVAVYTHPSYLVENPVLNYAIVATDRPARQPDEVDDYETWPVAQMAGDIEPIAIAPGRVLSDDSAPLAPLVAPTMKYARRLGRGQLPIEILID